VVAPLSHLLDLQPAGDDRFSAPTHGPEGKVPQVFGGHLIAQATLAASRTVEGKLPHAAHCTFLKPGQAGADLELSVERLRDGRSFANRQVTVRQEGVVLCLLAASFAAPGEGEDWTATPMPDVAPPPAEARRGFVEIFPSFEVFEIHVLTDDLMPERQHPQWIKVADPLPDDPSVHTAAIAGMTDVSAAPGTARPGYAPGRHFRGASVDHSIWFHRPARADEWLLFDLHPLSNQSGRGLGIGRAWAADGTHVLTWTQEALLRFG
jgi:acyl-CoA thioesterase-2